MQQVDQLVDNFLGRMGMVILDVQNNPRKAHASFWIVLRYCNNFI